MKNDDRKEQVLKNFEEILPELWDKAKANEVKLKSEYLSKLQTKLLEIIQSKVPKDHFNFWFDEKLCIEDLTEDNRITFGTVSELNAAWLELRYSDLLKETLRSIINVGIKFELSFVVKKDNVLTKLEEKSFEELFEAAFGKKELERQKKLLQKRILKQDYAEGELNLVACPICDCEDVPNVDLERKLNSYNSRLKSIMIRGGRCNNCSEEFYKPEDMEAIAKIKELLEGLFPTT